MNLNFYEVYVNPSECSEARFESLWKNEAIEKADQLKSQHPNQTVIVTLWHSGTNRDEVVYEATTEVETTPTPIIADIQKDIRWDRATKDYACYIIIDGGEPQYIGSARNNSEAERITNQYAYDYLMDSHTIETATELLMQVAA